MYILPGLFRGSQNKEMRLGLCQRTSDVIEPMIKPQWYVNCSTIAKEALDVATNDENKKLEFIPKQYTAEWRRLISFIILTLWFLSLPLSMY